MAAPAVIAAAAVAATAVVVAAKEVFSAVVATRNAINGAMPTLEDEVTVEIKGQPGHSKQDLYFLALATANGMVRRFGELNGIVSLISPSFGMLMCEYDQSDNWVRCTMRYKWGMAQAAVPSWGSIAKGKIGAMFDQLVVYRGPQCNAVGGTFDFTSDSTLAVGIPDKSSSTSAPQLPFAGQMVLTDCPSTPPPTPAAITQPPVPDFPLKNPGSTKIPSPNPKPPGDNRSRGAVSYPTGSPPPSPGTPSRTITIPGFTGNPTVTIPGTPSTPGVLTTTTPGAGKPCCDSVQALIPLVFAALSAPASNSDMTFPLPPASPVTVG